MDYELPLPGAAGSGSGAGAGSDAADVPDAGRGGARLGTAPVGGGYFCATVGAVNEQMVREYIERQKRDEAVGGFQVTAPESP